LTASYTWKVVGLPRDLEAYEIHPLDEGRYERQGTHRADALAVFSARGPSVILPA